MFFDLIKIENDLLIVIFAIIALLFIGLIFIIIRSILYSASIEKVLSKKMKNKDYYGIINLSKSYLEKKRSGNDKDRLSVLYYTAEAYESLNLYDNAIKFYKEAQILADRHKKLKHSIILHMAHISQKLNNTKEALSYFILLLDQDPNNSIVLYELALFQYQNKNIKKARDYLEKLLKRRPGLLDARILFGKIIFEMGNYNHALKQFTLLEKYDSKNHEVRYYKAKILENLKRYNDAIHEYHNLLTAKWENPVPNSIKSEIQIAIINLYIKLKNYTSGIQYVSEFLSTPSDEGTKIELIYLYANLLWNCGEEFQALKNYERVYLMKSDYKDVAIMYERYKKILPHIYLKNYFVGNDKTENNDFETVCKSILRNKNFNLLYKHSDYYIFSKGVFFVVFYRHIEPIAFSKLTDMEIIMNSYDIKPQNIEIYSLSGIREDTVTHMLLKNSEIIQSDEMIDIIKKVSEKEIGKLN